MLTIDVPLGREENRAIFRRSYKDRVPWGHAKKSKGLNCETIHKYLNR